MLDSGLLGMLAHPRQNRDAAEWSKRLLQSGATLIIPEIADYELRRNLLLEGLDKSIERLNALKGTLQYLPLDTEAMLSAAALWAEARRRGRPTADAKALDGDVILAAQAKQVGAVVATDNVDHLAQFVDARPWKDIGES